MFRNFFQARTVRKHHRDGKGNWFQTLMSSHDSSSSKDQSSRHRRRRLRRHHRFCLKCITSSFRALFFYVIRPVNFWSKPETGSFHQNLTYFGKSSAFYFVLITPILFTDTSRLQFSHKSNLPLGGEHGTRVSMLASRPRCPGFNSLQCQKFSEEKLLMLLRLINGTGKRKVDSGLKILIEPI